MTNRRNQSMLLFAAAILAFAFSAAAPGQEQKPLDASDIADGMRLFQQKANCQACHGWAGDGHKSDSQMPDGANLRETKLNRAGLVLLIKCGKPTRKCRPSTNLPTATDAAMARNRTI